MADLANLTDVLLGILRDGDLLLTLGAGSIGSLAATLPEKFAEAVEARS